MNKQQVLTRIALLFQSDFRNYVLNPTEVNASKLTASQKRTLDGLISNPSNYSLSDLQNFIDGSVSNYTQKYNNARDALDSYTPPPPEPVSSTVVGAGAQPGQVPVGSAPVRTDIEPGELSRPARPTGAGDIEPGEMSRPGMGAVPGAIPTEQAAPGAAPDGFEWQYDPLQSKPVLVPIGEPATEQEIDTGPSGPSGPAIVTDVAEMPADANIPKDWRNAAAEAYPQYYAIVRNVPEIARLLEEAIANTYTPEQFQAKLEQTSWWQQTTASAREWDINGQRDPATQQTLIDNKRVEVRNLALSAFGVQLSDEKLEQLTVDSLRFGWSYNFLQNAIGDVATQSTVGISQLRQGYIGQTIRQTAKRYGVALADETFNSFVSRIAVGQETTDSFENYASNIARSLYPTLTAQFDSGLTFEDAVSPYRQVAANLLELNPNDIDFMDPKWLTPITYMPDPQSGEQRLMNLAEWGQELRTNKAFGYEFTNQARETAYRVTTDLANLFGRV